MEAQARRAQQRAKERAVLLQERRALARPQERRAVVGAVIQAVLAAA